MVKIAPSLLSADFLHLEREIARVADAGADWLHFDVMDGAFVPDITFGPPILRAVTRLAALPADVHLMVEAPERQIERFAEAGAHAITVHAESARHLYRTLARIRECGCQAGVAFNPGTPPDCLRYVLGAFDLVLVMTVDPGFGGQRLIEPAARKIFEIRRMLDAAGVQAEIMVDGGVNLETAPGLIELGATVLIAGSALFGAPDLAAFIHQIKNA